MKKIAAATLTMFVLTACGDPQAGGASGGEPEHDIPSFLNVTCGPGGATAISEKRVAVQSDGLHVRMDNQAGEPVSLNGIGWDFSEGTSGEFVPVPPGEVEVACSPYSTHEEIPDPTGVDVELVDPDGYWVDPELECESDMTMSVISDHFFASPGEKRDPVEIVTDGLKGVRETDIVGAAGYPDATNPQVRVVRDGRTIAVVRLDRAENGGYLIGGGDFCDNEVRF